MSSATPQRGESDTPGGASRWLSPWKLPLATAFAVVVGDQVTKYLIVANWKLGERTVVFPGFFNIVHFRNSGAAWGMFSGQALFLALFSIAALVFIFARFQALIEGSRARAFALALITGGIVGNLIDRLHLGEVIDFLFFFYRSFRWPAFNIADSAITVGVTLFVITSLFSIGDPHPKREQVEA